MAESICRIPDTRRGEREVLRCARQCLLEDTPLPKGMRCLYCEGPVDQTTDAYVMLVEGGSGAQDGCAPRLPSADRAIAR